MSEIARGWTVTQVIEKVHRPETYAPVNVVRYVAKLYADAHTASQMKFGQMTKEEAQAMAKLLNASTTD